MMKYKLSCNKCNVGFSSIHCLNDNEFEELIELGHFTCTDCIQEEMEVEE